MYVDGKTFLRHVSWQNISFLGMSSQHHPSGPGIGCAQWLLIQVSVPLGGFPPHFSAVSVSGRLTYNRNDNDDNNDCSKCFISK